MARKKDIIEVELSEMDLFVIDKVREIRAQKQVSQVDLSILMGMSEGVIGKIENPRQRDKFNLRHINLLAKARKCSPKDFFPEKPLSNDLVRVKLRAIKQPNSSRGKPNYEIISKQVVDE